MNDEMPRQIEARRGFSIFYRGKNLLSLIDPIAQAERIAGSVFPKTRTLYFCPSPLFGYGLAKLLAGLNADSAVLCIETDEKLMSLSLEAMEESLLLHPRLRYIRTRDAAALCAFVRETWGSRSFRRLEIIRLSGGWQLDSPLYEALAAALRRDIATDWGNAMTLVKLGRRYIRNAFRNMALIPDTPTLGDLYLGSRPVLVLGAGPSLDGLLEGLLVAFGEKLKESAGRPFAVICADTCLLALLSRNIKPDLVVALESQHWNLRDFIGAGSQTIPLAMDLSALPATREVLGGQVFLFVTPWTPLRIFERLRERRLLPEALAPLGSVGLSAVALALRISSGPVIAGGIDFSFTLDRFHARNTPGHLNGLNRHDRFHPLINTTAFRPGVFRARSKSGERVLSDPVMKNYRELFEQEFSREERLSDITGTGLPLGIKTLSREAAFALLQDAPAAMAGDIPLATASEHFPKARADRQPGEERRQALEGLIRRERESLIALRNSLTGESPLSPEETEKLLDGADYLWAHFPECAGAGGRHPPVTDISFLKRIRTEIDPFIGIFDLLLRELSAGPCRRRRGK
ncbi:MAG: DUF115 domain-containing protein [Treponema sp.]|jgi:hypothetical protein|nr:DUF115 domain-containing protein [Treponema sp.]